jgi:hypothetical protein
MYAQFQTMSTGYIQNTIPPQFGAPYPIDATGDRGIIKLDGRMSLTNMHSIAKVEQVKRGYIGYRLIAKIGD